MIKFIFLILNLFFLKFKIFIIEKIIKIIETKKIMLILFSKYFTKIKPIGRASFR